MPLQVGGEPVCLFRSPPGNDAIATGASRTIGRRRLSPVIGTHAPISTFFNQDPRTPLPKVTGFHMPSQPSARSILVSYASVDRAEAERLIGMIQTSAPGAFNMALAQAGDVREMETPSSEDWLPELAARLRGVHAVLALVSKSYLNSDMCWFEGSTALGMNKLIPVKIDTALSHAELPEPFRRTNIPTMNIAALADNDAGKAHLGSPEAARAFMSLVDELGVASSSRRPFETWQESEVLRVGETALALQKAFRWPFQRKGLNWSQGKLGAHQRFRFLAAISDFANCAGGTFWDAARRRALRALHAAPGDASVRSATVLGLIGELSSADAQGGDGANRNLEPWRWLGDLALPFDRQISRFAYARAGDIPNDVRETFEIMHQKSAGRAARAWTGLGFGLAIGTGLGVVLATVLGSPPSGRLAAARASAPLAPTAQKLTPPAAPRPAPTTSPGTVAAPAILNNQPTAPNAAQLNATSPTLANFSVDAKGLEYTVKAKLRANRYEFSWQEVYAATIAVNRKVLCSPERRAQAGLGADPLNAIGDAEIFEWPTLDEVKAHRADARACRLPAVVTTLPG